MGFLLLTISPFEPPADDEDRGHGVGSACFERLHEASDGIHHGISWRAEGGPGSSGVRTTDGKPSATSGGPPVSPFTSASSSGWTQPCALKCCATALAARR